MSAYIHTVLAPEAAVLLIMEDLRVDQSRAIEILEDSHDIGDIMHSEPEDQVL